MQDRHLCQTIRRRSGTGSTLDHPNEAGRSPRIVNDRRPIQGSDNDRSTRPKPSASDARVASAIHAHWGLFLAEGIILVILGIAAIVLPPIATLAVTIVIGWLFLVSGIVGLITTFWMRHAPGFWWSLISAFIGIAAGIVLLAWPITGTLSLTLVLIAFFVVEGIASIMYAIEHRNQLPGRWGWMLVSGIVDLILAGIIFAGLPGTAAWALGLLVGINMLFGGAAMIAMALAARTGMPAFERSGNRVGAHAGASSPRRRQDRSTLCALHPAVTITPPAPPAAPAPSPRRWRYRRSPAPRSGSRARRRR